MTELRVIQGTPDSDEKRCGDCRHMESAVSWWCTNRDAIDVRATLIPETRLCRFWEPALPATPPKWWQRLFGISPDGDCIATSSSVCM